MAPGRRDAWIRLPREKRRGTVGGREDLVGVAEGRGVREEGEGERDEEEDGIALPLDPKELLDCEEPDMEIEQLIIPAVEELHTAHMERFSKR